MLSVPSRHFFVISKWEKAWPEGKFIGQIDVIGKEKASRLCQERSFHYRNKPPTHKRNCRLPTTHRTREQNKEKTQAAQWQVWIPLRARAKGTNCGQKVSCSCWQGLHAVTPQEPPQAAALEGKACRWMKHMVLKAPWWREICVPQKWRIIVRRELWVKHNRVT